MQLVLKSFRNNWHIYIRIQNWLNTSSLHVMLFQILWRLFTAQLFKSHNFFMPAFMLHKCTHALNYLLLKFVYKKTLFTYNNGLKIGVSLFSFNFVFMWYFFNLHSKHLFINTPVLYTVSLLSPFLYYIQQCWTEGRSSTAVAEDLRPTATATVAEVWGHSYGRRSYW